MYSKKSVLTVVTEQGIVYLNRTRQLFRRMFVTLKKFNELFHPT